MRTRGSTQLESVRVAASTRRFLVSGWVYVLWIVVWFPFEVGTSFELPEWLRTIPLITVVPAYFWFNRRHAVWIERDVGGFRVRTRRWWKPQDLASGRLRSEGKIGGWYPPGTAVSYDPKRIAWWRADRSLMIGGDRYSVWPDARKLAKALVDERRWVASGQST